MKYVLDTDTLIYFFKEHPGVVKHFISLSPDELSTTIINHAELMFGAFNSAKKQQNIKKLEQFFTEIAVLPFCERASTLFAEEKTRLKKLGIIVADLDMMIASIAITHNLVLVSNNMKHFRRIKKLKLENWAGDD